MQYQLMRPDPQIIEEGDHRKLKKHQNVPCRWVQQVKKLKELPSKYLDFVDHEHIQIDVSYNKTLVIDKVFDQLIDLKQGLKGLAYSKNTAPILPEKLFQLTELEELEWRSNGVKQLPEEFSLLTSLKHINFRHNNIKDFPKSILALKELKTLNLRFNKIKAIPDEIGNLVNLEHIDFSGCGLTEIPESIGKLKNLKKLELEGNKITKLPESILNLASLEHVNLKDNPDIDLTLLIELYAKQGIKKVQFYNYNLTSLPSNIGQLKELEEIDLSGNKLTSFPESFKELKTLKKIRSIDFSFLSFSNYIETMSHLPQMKDLRLSGNVDFDSHLSELISNWTHLEEVALTYSKELAKFPPFIYQISNLVKLRVSGTGIRSIDLQKLPKSIEEIHLAANPELEITNDFHQLKKLRELTIVNNKNQPDVNDLNKIGNLKSLSLDELDQDILAGLTSLQGLEKLNLDFKSLPSGCKVDLNSKELKELVISNCASISHEDLINLIVKNKALERLRVDYTKVFDYNHVNKVLTELRSLKDVNLQIDKQMLRHDLQVLTGLEKAVFNIQNNYTNKDELVWVDSSFVNLNHENIGFSRNNAAVNAAINIVAEIDALGVSDLSYRQFLFDILSGNFDSLDKKLTNPFSNNSINDNSVYVLGRPSFLKKAEIKTLFSSQGAKIVNDAEQATAVLLCMKPDEDLLRGFVENENIVWVLEDHLRQLVIDEEKPFLMDDENSELNDQITRLLTSKDEDNLSLLLSMLEGGGVTRKTSSYVLAILNHHRDKDIRKQARSIFKKFSSSSLQDHIKTKWKASYSDKDLYRFDSAIRHPEIDYMAYILAYKYVWAYNMTSQSGGGNIDYNFSRLNLSDVSQSNLSESFKDFSFLEGLTIRLKDEITGVRLFELIKNNPLKSLSVQADFKDYPIELLDFGGLESLDVGVYTQQSMNVDLACFSANSSIKNLGISNGNIIGSGEVLKSFQALEQLTYRDCKIGSLSYLNTINLTRLSIQNCHLKKFPSEIASQKKLEYLSLSQNNIKEVDFDFSGLDKLKTLHLNHNEVVSIADTFLENEYLEDVNLSNNRMKEFPTSLLAHREKGSYSGVNLDLRNNQISKMTDIHSAKKWLGIFSSGTHRKFGKINRIYLENNCLHEIPQELFRNEKIYELNLNENPIKTLPANLDKLNVEKLHASIQDLHVSGRIFNNPILRAFYICSDHVTMMNENEIPEHKIYNFNIYPKQNTDSREGLVKFCANVSARLVEET